MKSMAAFSLIVLLCVPAKAQSGGMGGGSATQAKSVELELLEIEQEADKAALKEALLLQARQGMQQIRGTDHAKRQAAEDVEILRDFIDMKKREIVKRAAELGKSRISSLRRSTTATASTADQPALVERQVAIEKIEAAQVEDQLLQAKINLLQNGLSEAINVLAALDVAAEENEAKRAEAEKARMKYEKIRAGYIVHKKRQQMIRQELQSMYRMQGMEVWVAACNDTPAPW
jgi:hypothetical protein